MQIAPRRAGASPDCFFEKPIMQFADFHVRTMSESLRTIQFPRYARRLSQKAVLPKVEEPLERALQTGHYQFRKPQTEQPRRENTREAEAAQGAQSHRLVRGCAGLRCSPQECLHSPGGLSKARFQLPFQGSGNANSLFQPLPTSAAARLAAGRC